MRRLGRLGEPLFLSLNIILSFITHESSSFNKISIHVITFLPNPNFLKTKLRKSWSREPKAFSISIVTRNPSIFNQSLISIKSEINLPLSPIDLFLLKQFVVRKVTLAKQLFCVNV